MENKVLAVGDLNWTIETVKIFRGSWLETVTPQDRWPRSGKDERINNSHRLPRLRSSTTARWRAFGAC
jgi:hypothetical protein